MRETTLQQWLDATFEAACYLGYGALVMVGVVIVSGFFSLSLS